MYKVRTVVRMLFVSRIEHDETTKIWNDSERGRADHAGWVGRRWEAGRDQDQTQVRRELVTLPTTTYLTRSASASRGM